jgi:hypothetical protein
LQHPAGLAYADRLVYVADTYNNKIKVLDPFAGQVQTLIGSGEAGWQDGPFESARLFEPEGLQVHAVQEHAAREGGVDQRAEQQASDQGRAGQIYIADTNNHLIRVADLGQRQVHTFRLRGLERLAVRVEEGEDQVERLPEVMIGAGRVRLTLDVKLPPGYQRNPETPAVLRVSVDGHAQDYMFTAQEAISWWHDLGASRDLDLDVTIYYCRESEMGLCLIDSRKTVLPLRITAGGPLAAQVRYTLPGEHVSF